MKKTIMLSPLDEHTYGLHVQMSGEIVRTLLILIQEQDLRGPVSSEWETDLPSSVSSLQTQINPSASLEAHTRTGRKRMGTDGDGGGDVIKKKEKQTKVIDGGSSSHMSQPSISLFVKDHAVANFVLGYWKAENLLYPMGMYIFLRKL